MNPTPEGVDLPLRCGLFGHPETPDERLENVDETGGRHEVQWLRHAVSRRVIHLAHPARLEFGTIATVEVRRALAGD